MFICITPFKPVSWQINANLQFHDLILNSVVTKYSYYVHFCSDYVVLNQVSYKKVGYITSKQLLLPTKQKNSRNLSSYPSFYTLHGQTNNIFKGYVNTVLFYT